MLITPAQAHGLLGGEPGAHDGPLILLTVLIVVVSLLVAESKWRRRKRRLQDHAEEPTEADSS